MIESNEGTFGHRGAHNALRLLVRENATANDHPFAGCPSRHQEKAELRQTRCCVGRSLQEPGIKTEFKIMEAQTSAWNQLANAIRTAAKNHNERLRAIFAGEERSQTLPERIDAQRAA